MHDHTTHAGGDECAGCGEALDVLNRCQRVIPNDVGLGFRLRFVCPTCYTAETDGDRQVGAG